MNLFIQKITLKRIIHIYDSHFYRNNFKKNMNKYLLILFTLILTSCSESNYYQIFKTNSENGIEINKQIVFEDSNCLVYYNLWQEGGDIGFSIFNKTEKELIIHLNKSFFVLNDVAYAYFQNRSYTKSSSTGTSLSTYNYPYYWNYNISKVTGSVSSGFATTYIEKPELIIPPKTFINISEFNITNTRYANCDLIKYPSLKNIKTLKFSKENSPFRFYNTISYSTISDTIRFENRFYVSEITNIPSSEMYREIDKTACGKKLDFPIWTIKDLSPDRFYIKYSSER